MSANGISQLTNKQSKKQSLLLQQTTVQQQATLEIHPTLNCCLQNMQATRSSTMKMLADCNQVVPGSKIKLDTSHVIVYKYIHAAESNRLLHY